MPILLKKVAKELSDYPRNYKQYPRLMVSKLESRSAPDLKYVVFKSFVKSEKTSTKSENQYVNYIQFFGIEFSKEKTKEFSIPAESEGRLFYHKKPSINENPVYLKCSCADFQFRFEKPLYDNGGLLGDYTPYTRKTPPPPEGNDYLNPAQDNLVKQNAASYTGFCKHIFSLLRTLRESELITD